MKKESRYLDWFREETVGESFSTKNIEVPFGAVMVNGVVITG